MQGAIGKARAVKELEAEQSKVAGDDEVVKLLQQEVGERTRGEAARVEFTGETCHLTIVYIKLGLATYACFFQTKNEICPPVAWLESWLLYTVASQLRRRSVGRNTIYLLFPSSFLIPHSFFNVPSMVAQR